jgi:hypothetical protein
MIDHTGHCGPHPVSRCPSMRRHTAEEIDWALFLASECRHCREASGCRMCASTAPEAISWGGIFRPVTAEYRCECCGHRWTAEHSVKDAGLSPALTA